MRTRSAPHQPSAIARCVTSASQNRAKEGASDANNANLPFSSLECFGSIEFPELFPKIEKIAANEPPQKKKREDRSNLY